VVCMRDSHKAATAFVAFMRHANGQRTATHDPASPPGPGGERLASTVHMVNKVSRKNREIIDRDEVVHPPVSLL
jgi:hypothetical protein